MKKCMNNSDNFVEESLSGIVKAHSDFYQFSTNDNKGIIYKGNKNRKVKIVTGGGYGHLPLFLGYVGEGLCDGVAIGNIFTSPSSETIQNVAKDMDSDQVLFLFGNYFGDTMNFEMAGDMLELDGITTAIVKGSDDLASSDVPHDRRGVAGILFAYKIAGAAADMGYDLAKVAEITQNAVDNMSSLGVAFSSCVLPGAEKSIFEISDTDMEIGMGIHGEPGIHRAEMMDSKTLAGRLTEDCLKDLGIEDGEKIAVLVNGLGSTSREELYVIYNDIEAVLAEHNLNICKVYVDEYVTSMEMAGLSLTILRVDEEREKMLFAKATTPFVNL